MLGQITRHLFTRGCRELFVTRVESLSYLLPGEEIARPCARTLELWLQLKLNTRAFLVNSSRHSYSSLTLAIFSNNLFGRPTRSFHSAFLVDVRED